MIILRRKMIFNYNNIDFKVVIEKKRIKNTYIRIKEHNIYVTTNYLTSNRQINNLLISKRKFIIKMLDKDLNKWEKEKVFYLFGKVYNIIYTDKKEIKIDNNNIYIKNENELQKWLNNYLKTTFSNHLNYWYEIFNESIPIPNLKIRKMKTRWGVCNTGNNNITLNYELYRYDIDCLDYVIVHELSHFIYPNHSKKFWNLVEKYYPNYKISRKKLKDS